MSRIWSADSVSGAAPLESWGNFGSVGRDGRGFRHLYAEEQGHRAWNVTFPGGSGPGGDYDETLAVQAPVDPIEEAARDAFVQGFQEGERITREAAEQDDAARRELAAAVLALGKVDEGAFATLLSQAVIRLVGQIVGEVPIDADVLRARCEAVAACIDTDDAKARLEVNPEDLPLLQAEPLRFSLAASADVPRGSVRLATAEGWIEDGPDVRLARLKALMDDMEGRL
ncbi:MULTISPECIES: flagellar biosynthesis protein [unclassified Sphingobium]|uniref:FliH/SctL family protein n=1 Tax=unclassified Sphingobium TaxID=2611147 RepID=UPI00222538E6|nr:MULTISPECIES: flagellar biosynthesis protein [unclassified Sphingobium]MCW2348667.1 flagellar assembly protein FliH [Sphingobium sp. B12D2B]MCW2396031.1 flagellar assembly protein FliH [Sphingobium sp. B8D3B]MCW2419547.1 flagellar assembly protein FliH [Sphingobium sp. B8D3C]